MWGSCAHRGGRVSQTLGFVVPFPQLHVLPRAFISSWEPKGHGEVTSSVSQRCLELCGMRMYWHMELCV